jgi:hypothetical protein
MNIMLGNLTVSEIEKRTGVIFPEELKQLMEKTHQHEASNISNGKWHCFDIPFVLVCGGMPLAQEIYDHLRIKSGEFKEKMEIALAK